MKLELTVYELGNLLRNINDEYEMSILFKSALSGGWITISGKANITKVPKGNNIVKDNIIHIKINEGDKEEILIKLTGVNNKMFNVDISSSRYKEIAPRNITLDTIKINENETKLRIDDNVIFTIKAGVEDIKRIYENNQK